MRTKQESKLLDSSNSTISKPVTFGKGLHLALGIKGSTIANEALDREDEIKRCRKIIRNYKIMNVIISFYSGMLMLTIYPNVFYVKNTLKMNSAIYTRFDAIVKSSWLLKPVFGYLSDSIFPFRYRMKSYIFMMMILHLAMTGVIYFGTNDLVMFTISVFFIYFSVGFVDSLGEGMTAIITKMLMRIKMLESSVLEEYKEKKAVGNYFIIRLFIRTISSVAGGFMTNIHIQKIYLILGFFPAVLLVYIIVFFKEERSNKRWVGKGKVKSDIKMFIKMLSKPSIFVPLGFVIINSLCPNLGDAGIYVLTNMADWTFQELSINTLLFGIVYAGLMGILINKIKSFKYGYLMLLGCFTMGVYNLINYCLLFAQEIPFGVMFGIQFVQSLFQQMAYDLPSIATIGKLTRYIPVGFETTGVTVLISIGNIGIITGGLLASYQINYYKSIAGFYERLFTPITINSIYCIIVIIVCPLFVSLKVKNLKERAGFSYKKPELNTSWPSK